MENMDETLNNFLMLEAVKEEMETPGKKKKIQENQSFGEDKAMGRKLLKISQNLSKGMDLVSSSLHQAHQIIGSHQIQRWAMGSGMGQEFQNLKRKLEQAMSVKNTKELSNIKDNLSVIAGELEDM